MRRNALTLVASLLVLTSCTDTSRPTAFMAPPSARYQLTQSGTLDSEIIALIQALFHQPLEADVLTRWSTIRSRLAGGEINTARAKLVDATAFIEANESQMDPPPNNESISTATARLVLYMSLYVYSGPTTPVPPQMGIGSDAAMEIVKPNQPALIQTPLMHAATSFDVGTVTTNTIVVVTQNTTFYQSHCSGPFTTKYCQYPIYYEFHSFPHVKFQKPVRVAMCPVPPGGDYGVLPGADDDELVRAHDKPANPSSYIPGGLPVSGEAIEILPINTDFDPTNPTILCTGATYPDVALFHIPPRPIGVLEIGMAKAAQAANSVARFVGRVLTPKVAYAIDSGVEHLAFEFSQFAILDTIGRPDLKLSQTAVVSRDVPAGGFATINYSLTNGGAAPSPGVVTTIRLTPTHQTPGAPIDLVQTQPASSAQIYPLDNRTETVVVKIPDQQPLGTYVVSVIVNTVNGLPENAATLTDNTQVRELNVKEATFRVSAPVVKKK